MHIEAMPQNITLKRFLKFHCEVALTLSNTFLSGSCFALNQLELLNEGTDAGYFRLMLKDRSIDAVQRFALLCFYRLLIDFAKNNDHV